MGPHQLTDEERPSPHILAGRQGKPDREGDARPGHRIEQIAVVVAERDVAALLLCRCGARNRQDVAQAQHECQPASSQASPPAILWPGFWDQQYAIWRKELLDSPCRSRIKLQGASSPGAPLRGRSGIRRESPLWLPGIA